MEKTSFSGTESNEKTRFLGTGLNDYQPPCQTQAGYLTTR